MLEVRDLVAGYGGVPILRGISLDVAPAKWWPCWGRQWRGQDHPQPRPVRVIRADQGSITFGGEPIHALDPAAIVARGLIHVPEGRKIFPNMTVRENLELGAYRRARGNRNRNLEQAFTTFPRLKERESQLAGTLSGGEQQCWPSDAG